MGNMCECRCVWKNSKKISGAETGGNCTGTPKSIFESVEVQSHLKDQYVTPNYF